MKYDTPVKLDALAELDKEHWRDNYPMDRNTDVRWYIKMQTEQMLRDAQQYPVLYQHACEAARMVIENAADEECTSIDYTHVEEVGVYVLNLWISVNRRIAYVLEDRYSGTCTHSELTLTLVACAQLSIWAFDECSTYLNGHAAEWALHVLQYT